jgi:SHS2 domain-containing protein
MYELFEHTADLGLRVRAADLQAVFVDAGRALFAAIVENPGAIRLQETHEIHLEGEELELLLFDWLRELLYLFDARHLVFNRFEVTVDKNRLAGQAQGEPFDHRRHIPLHEVKAITYHGLRLVKEANGWLAEVIVDI